MSRCIKMTFNVSKATDKMLQVVQQQALALELEGLVVASTPENVKIVACGSSEKIDSFLDTIDEFIARSGGHNITIDPFLKDKDYRGVFRIMF